MPSLLKDLIFTRFTYRWVILLCSFLAAFAGILSPFFQKEFIDALTGQKLLVDLQWSPITYIVWAFLGMIVSQAFLQAANYLGAREALFMQKILSQKIYEKTLRLRVDTLSRKSIGETVALYATDVSGATVFLDQTLPTGASTLFPLLIAPFAIAFIFDVSIGPTIGLMILVSTINTSLAFRQSKFFFKFKQLAAERIGLVNEWIQNIRTLRILGWIPVFEEKIFHKRILETNNRVAMVTNGQMMNAISSSVTFFLNILTLYYFITWSDKILSPGEILALLWIAGIFLTRPFRQMPWFFTFAFDAWTSLKRLQNFLDMPGEISNTYDTQNLTPLRKTNSLQAISVENLNLRIGSKDILNGISFNIERSELIGIVGEVGAGKSLLLLALLKETSATFDKYKIFDQEALKLSLDDLRQFYSLVPQEGFIMSATLRENISLLYDINKEQDENIKKSLSLAQMDLDTDRLPHGLDTEIGERGVNLSGGQKQRASLARVDFLNAPILLLDDCLSALDAETEEKIFQQLILGAWKDKTRLLVTHRLSALKYVDRIFFMEDGHIIAQGTFKELLDHHEKFRNYTKTLSETSQTNTTLNLKDSLDEN